MPDSNSSGEVAGSDDDAVFIGSDDICDFNPGHVLPQNDTILANIRTWLNPTEYDHDGSEYKKHISSHLHGTGEWVYTSKPYREWNDGDSHGILLIRGIPGSGKSVLAASLVEHLRSQGHPVLYFFFRHTIQANHSPAAALRDWLAQVLRFSPPLQQELQKCTSLGDVEQLTLADLYAHLRTALGHMSKVYCLVDALDEMDQEALEPFLRLLDDLGQWRPHHVKLVITSRPVAIIDKTIRGVKVLDVRLDRSRVESDIARYIEHRLHHSPIPRESHHIVQETVLERADGVFLYARLALDILSETQTDLQSSLEALPTDLAVVYANLLEEHAKRSGVPSELQQLILEVVTHGTRPLRLLEIADLITVTQQNVLDLGATKDLVRLACGPLLEVLPDETIRVVHHSLTEYLKGNARQPGLDPYPVFEPGPTHNKLSLLCISYLKSGCLDLVRTPNIHGDDEFDGFFGSVKPAPLSTLPPFTQYAGTNWHVHVRKAFLLGHDQTEANTALRSLLIDENSGKLAHLAKVYVRCGLSALGLATAFQLESYVEEILTSTTPTTETSQKTKDMALRHAASKGYVRIVRLLLESGADPRTYNERGLTSLHIAVHGRHHEVVKALLEAGMDPLFDAGPDNTFDDNTIGERPAMLAAMSAFGTSDIKMVSIFLEYLKTPEAITIALHCAVERRDGPAVELLLQHPHVDINAKEGGRTALYKACAERDAELIDLLLKGGADPNIMYQERMEKDTGYNALHSLAGWGYPMGAGLRKADEEETTKCFKLVLGAGAKVDQVDIKKRTPLHLALEVAAVRCLLEGGADPNATNAWGETLLHITNDEKILEFLADKVDINLKTTYKSYSPLLSTLAERYSFGDYKVQKVNRLLDLGADVNVVDHDGNGALHHSVKFNRLSLIQKLLDHGADVNQKNNQGKTPLHMLCPGAEGKGFQVYSQQRFDADVMDILVAAGADLEARDNKGETPLFQMICCWNGQGDQENIKNCEKMMEKGARLDTVDLQGRTLLHGAVRYTDDQATLLRFLVSRGLDPKQTDHDGNTLWHVAAPHFAKRSARYELFKELTSMGVDPKGANNSGRTPFHILSSFLPSALEPGGSYYSNGRKVNADDATAFDYFLDLQENVDCTDNGGVTPLHLASTFSEYQTRRLLEAGARPERATHEGLTPFHLAARSRQGNILGILLNWMELNVSREAAMAILEARDERGRSAVYYACASGRLESVELLLRAGTTIETDTYVGSAWEGCVDFEEEQKLPGWTGTFNGSGDDQREADAGGVTIADSMRPRLKPQTHTFQAGSFPAERLDEILELLVIHGPISGRQFVDQAISSALEKKHDYTVKCLLRARAALGLEQPHSASDDLSASLQRRQEAMTARPGHGMTELEHLMSLREYDAACGIMLRDSTCWQDGPTSRAGGSPMLHRLAMGGFATLLGRVLLPGRAQKDEGGQLLDERAPEDQISPSTDELLLGVACHQTLPNMHVIRLLVEDVGISVNVQVRVQPYLHSGRATALHCLVRGGHWWQIEEALPYLLKNGADTEACDEGGQTPLSVALGEVDGPNFSKRAVEILLESGANPNAVDRNGTSCLSRAGSHREIYQLLVRHGAVVTASALSAAIEKEDCDLLQLMLSSGTDPNLREVGKEVPYWTSPDGKSCSPAQHDPDTPSQVYPLELVVSKAVRDEPQRQTAEKMLNMLLEYGAEPSARYEATTIMHRLVQNQGLNGTWHSWENHFMRTLLRHPKVALEARDDQGRTLLLVASHQGLGSCDEIDSNGRSLVQYLLELGADLHASDHRGRTALHHLVSAGTGFGFGGHTRQLGDIASILEAAPGLLHATDNDGNQPLHCALAPLLTGHAAKQLILAGADVAQSVESTGDSPLHLLLRGAWRVGLDNKLVTTGEDGQEAAWRGEVLKCLLAMGPDVNARNHAGEPPIFGYFRAGTVSVVLPPEESRRGMQKIEDYVRRQRVESELAVEKERVVWEFFEEMGVDWRLVSGKGETLLHIVAGCDRVPERRLSRFRFLVGKGLDPFCEDEGHRTALDVAAASGADDILGLFKTVT